MEKICVNEFFDLADILDGQYFEVKKEGRTTYDYFILKHSGEVSLVTNDSYFYGNPEGHWYWNGEPDVAVKYDYSWMCPEGLETVREVLNWLKSDKGVRFELCDVSDELDVKRRIKFAMSRAVSDTMRERLEAMKNNLNDDNASYIDAALDKILTNIKSDASYKHAEREEHQRMKFAII